jgi:hypothetical protein
MFHSPSSGARVRRLERGLAPSPADRLGLLVGIQHLRDGDLRPERVQVKLEGGDDAEA